MNVPLVHVMTGTGAPETSQVKVAESPCITVRLDGGTSILGGEPAVKKANKHSRLQLLLSNNYNE